MEKNSILAFLLTSIFAQVLAELPFGIVKSETKNSEIENLGVCEKQIQVRENHFRCEIYSMADSRFYGTSTNRFFHIIETLNPVNTKKIERQHIESLCNKNVKRNVKVCF